MRPAKALRGALETVFWRGLTLSQTAINIEYLGTSISRYLSLQK
jgi:hypothetical protein